MKIAVFDTHRYERETFDAANALFAHDLAYFEPRLTSQTAPLATGFELVCSFVNDQLDAETLAALHGGGVRLKAYVPLGTTTSTCQRQQLLNCRCNTRLREELGFQYVDLAELYCQSEIISLHVPLTSKTHHLIDTATLARMRRGLLRRTRRS